MKLLTLFLKHYIGFLVLGCGFWSCNLSNDPASSDYYLSLLVNDSISQFDTVQIILLDPKTGDTRELLWDGPLAYPDTLKHLRTHYYRGENTNILIVAVRGDSIQYRRMVEFRGPGVKPRIAFDTTIAILKPVLKDTLPPILLLSGSDSIEIMNDGHFFDPGATCWDAHDGNLDDLIQRNGTWVDSIVGDYKLMYTCKDWIGNQAPSLQRIVYVRLSPDTQPPTLTLSLPDTVKIPVGNTFTEPGSACHDDREGTLQVAVTGHAEHQVPGTYVLTYNCQDSKGNAATKKQRFVVVFIPPDLNPPVLHFTGPDSISLFAGNAFVDPGATCRDEREGDLDSLIIRTGSITDTVPGVYRLDYSCRDHSGNQAFPIQRKVTFKLPPDTVPPVLVLLGQDTLRLVQGSAYIDPGGFCQDNREGALQVAVTGHVELQVPGTYVLTYNCKDSKGNAATEKRRIVVVLVPPDQKAPALLLTGSDSIPLFLGQVFVDPGATCRDGREGDLDSLIVRTGSVMDTVPGVYRFDYSCRDHAGNQAIPVQRKVSIKLPPDTIPPMLALLGQDTLRIAKGSAFIESGGSCKDARDGIIFVTIIGKVNTDSIGSYLLIYTCHDAAGNAAIEMRRVVQVYLPADVDAPVLAMIGADSLSIYLGAIFHDPGATCLDGRDGNMAVETVGVVNSALEGLYSIIYDCKDKAGNSATTKPRKVKVEIPPDTIAPILVLNGRDSVTVFRYGIFVDSGATCEDARDGKLPVISTGTPGMSALGLYAIVYTCTDKAGNGAVMTRTVVVIEPPDVTSPVLALVGSSDLTLFLDSIFIDSGATCNDTHDGVLPVTRTGSVDISRQGEYSLDYACVDAAGNVTRKSRKVVVTKSPELVTVLPAIKELMLDTGSWGTFNNGYTGIFAFGTWGDSPYNSIFQFDLSQVKRSGLQSAKAVFSTFGFISGWDGSEVNVIVHVFKLKSDWVEGTGNWYFSNASYTNGGDEFLSNYVLPDFVKSGSTDPAVITGTTNMAHELVRVENMIDLGTQNVTVRYTAKQSSNGEPAPPQGDLTPFEIDLTDYVKNTMPSEDHGIFVALEGIPGGRMIAVITKELGTGTLGPKLILSY